MAEQSKEQKTGEVNMPKDNVKSAETEQPKTQSNKVGLKNWRSTSMTNDLISDDE